MFNTQNNNIQLARHKKSFLGSGPNRGQNPVEWGDFLSVCLYICPPSGPSSQAWSLRLGWLAGWLGLRPGWLGVRPGWPELRPGCMAQRKGRTYIQTYMQTDGKSPHSTGFCPLLGPLPNKRGLIIYILVKLVIYSYISNTWATVPCLCWGCRQFADIFGPYLVFKNGLKFDGVISIWKWC